MTFGDRLKNTREEKQLTMEELSRLSGVNVSTIGNYENNSRKTPKPVILEKLANALQVDKNWLLVGAETKESIVDEFVEMLFKNKRINSSNIGESEAKLIIETCKYKLEKLEEKENS